MLFYIYTSPNLPRRFRRGIFFCCDNVHLLLTLSHGRRINMLIVAKKEEAEMLLNSIRELEVTIAEMDGEEEGSHGFMPSQLIALKNIKTEIEKELKSNENG